MDKMHIERFFSVTFLLALITACGDDDPVEKEAEIPDFIPTSGYSTPLEYDGMDLIWQDEFEGNSLNTQYWSYEIGDGCDKGICGWGNNELQWYTNTNAGIVAEDYLVITALRQESNGKSYTSSRIITEDKFEFQYGRVDIRAAIPEGKGLWPALWMLGTSGGTWPRNGEIDIMESGENGNDDLIKGTVHWDANGQYANFGDGKSFPDGVLQEEFHVYSIKWTEKFIIWYIDDEQFHAINIEPDDLSEFRNKFYFIFNVAVGGIFPGNPDETTSFPQRMVVDYVRVFQDQ